MLGFTLFILLIANFGYLFYMLAVFFKEDYNRPNLLTKPYMEDAFAVKHLLLVFVLPGIIFSYFLVGMMFGLLVGFEWISDKSFWNKPLFKRSEK